MSAATPTPRPRHPLARFAPHLTWLLGIFPATLYSLHEFRWGHVPLMWVLPGAVLAIVIILLHDHRHQRKWLLGCFLVLPILGWGIAVPITTLTVGQLTWTFVSSIAHALICLGVYRLLSGWLKMLPSQPIDILRMMVAAFVPSLALACLGFMPSTHPLTVDVYNLTWGLRAANVMFIGAMTLPILWWHRTRPREWRRDLLAIGPLLLIGVGLLFVYYGNRDTPMAWAVLFPAVFAGWVLSPRAAAAYTVTLSTIDMVVFLTPGATTYGGFASPELVAELLSTACSLACMLIALFRYQSLELARSLRKERSIAAEGADLLSGVFDAISEGVLVLDDRGRVLRHNVAASRMLGPDLRGSMAQWTKRVGLRDFDGSEIHDDSDDYAAIAAGESRTRELQLVGSGRTTRLAVQLTAYNDGGAGRVLAVVRDVTSERLKAEELRSFAGVVAHDLRTPLTTLRGWLEVLSDALADHPSPAIGKAAAAALQGSRRLGAVVDDWLTFTVGRDADLEFADRTVSSLVSDAVQDLEGGALVTIDAAHVVRVDPVLVRQIFANLLGNAVKYGRDGVRTQIQIRSVEDARPGTVRVEVRDNGLGVPPGDEDRIFEEFQRSHVGRGPGTGLGLALCRRVVERHGGTIGVHNNRGMPGATFWFTLPAPVTEHLEGEPDAAADLAAGGVHP